MYYIIFLFTGEARDATFNTATNKFRNIPACQSKITKNDTLSE